MEWEWEPEAVRVLAISEEALGDVRDRVDVLRTRLVAEVEARMDLAALAAVRQVEETERARLAALLQSA